MSELLKIDSLYVGWMLGGMQRICRLLIAWCSILNWYIDWDIVIRCVIANILKLKDPKYDVIMTKILKKAIILISESICHHYQWNPDSSSKKLGEIQFLTARPSYQMYPKNLFWFD